MTTYIIIGSVLLLIIILHFFRHKQAKSKVASVIRDNCTGCSRCIKKCRRKALEINTSNGKKYATINADLCTACGDCIKSCNFNALELVSRHTKSSLSGIKP